jgi:hypothetical protein
MFPDSSFKTEDILATSFLCGRAIIPANDACMPIYPEDRYSLSSGLGIYGHSDGDDIRGLPAVALSLRVFQNTDIIPNFKNVFKVYDIGEYKEFKTDANVKGLFTIGGDQYSYEKGNSSVRSPAAAQICDTLLWVLLFASIIAGGIMWRKLNWSIERKNRSSDAGIVYRRFLRSEYHCCTYRITSAI